MRYPCYSVCGRYQPLLVDGDELYVSRGYEVLVSHDDGDTFDFLARLNVPLFKRCLARVRVPSRIFREGFHGLVKGENGLLVGIVRGALVVCEPGSREFIRGFSVPRGSRPLNVCAAPNGGFYCGEYFSNPERDRVDIYGTLDGGDWTVVHSFSPGAIRHVHGVYYDPYRDGIWVLTGDRDQEAGLWYTADGFSSLELVAGGSQKARAVSIIPVPDGLIVPMDSPVEKNFIQHMDLARGQFTGLKELPGSAFYAGRVGGILLISTVVEPSEVNKDQRVAVFASLDGRDWHCFGRFARDFHQGLDRYLRYPAMVLVATNGEAKYIYGYGIGLKGLDGHCLRWSTKSVGDYLRAVSGAAA